VERAESVRVERPSPLSLTVGSFFLAKDAATALDASARGRSVEQLRRELPVARAQSPLSVDASKFLSRAAEALARNDAAAASVHAEEAARIAPDRPEPVEILLLAALSRGSAGEVRSAIARLAELDPRNAIPLAFAGLEAVQNGDDAAAVSALAWFVGSDALPRRGVAIPLPTAAGELEEQCALAALRLGHPRAALVALDAARATRPADRAAALRIALGRADAMHALGEDAEAEESLRAAVAQAVPVAGASEAPEDAMARALVSLARLRLDSLQSARGDSDEALEDAIECLLRDPRDSVALLRIDALTRGASESARRGAAKRVAALERADQARALRMTTVRTMLERTADPDALSRAVVLDARDRPALCVAMRQLASRGIELAVSTACEAVVVQPNELDAVTRALLGSGVEVDAILAAIERQGRGAAGDAVRSRIFGQFGFSEESFAIADAARTRDRASACALAACALAAAELEDETLLAEVDDDALAAGAAVARTLAACALRLDDFPKARDRAARAGVLDPTDARAALIGALAAIEDDTARDDAMRVIRSIASGSDSVAADAAAHLAEADRSIRRMRAGVGDGDGASDESHPPDLARESAPALLLAARELRRIRHPLADECLALAEEVDPGVATAEQLVARASSPDAAKRLSDWAHATAEDAPALPSRRRILASLHEPSASRVIPDAPLSARFDALQLADDGTRARERVSRSALRPKTPGAAAALAEASLAAGEFANTARVLESVAGAPSGPLPPRAAGRLFAAASALASRDSARVDAMQRVAVRMVARLVGIGPEQMAPAMRVMIETHADTSEVDLVATMLARACRASVPDARGRFSLLFGALLKADDDPYPVARLADALAREERFGPELSGFLGNSAVALQAAAGGPASQSAELVRWLAERGSPTFVRSDDPTTTLAESLLRAAAAYSLVGDASGSDELLRAAIAADPKLAPALNNLAFSRIESGSLNAETIELAELAARLAPDDPSVLDTLGVLRYHQGRFRDDASGPGAITLFRQALRVRPNDPSLGTLDHLGDALWRDGDQAGAVRVWQQVGEVAKLRYPPDSIARNLAEFQRREFGLELVQPSEFIRREYGRIVDRVEQKLQEVARGATPSVAKCLASP
jgi:tetratricopeptide (TPR) repeat protein